MPFFHLYGFLIGVAVVVAAMLIEYQAKKHGLNQSELWSVAGWILLSGLVGARAYHVITDYELYQHQWIDILKIWQGGLGIIGAIMGGVVGLCLYQMVRKKDFSFIKNWLDLAVFGLPFAQAIGRWGNFVNQELYGLPTNLPWGIAIDSPSKPNLVPQLKFHPLFAYEVILMLGFGTIVWIWNNRWPINIGTGRLFLTYVGFYTLIRFWLEFLRINRNKGWWIFDVNQIIVAVIFLLVVIVLKFKVKHE